MGEVTFARIVYGYIDDEGRKNFVYLLDEQLSFDTIGLISTNLAEKVVVAYEGWKEVSEGRFELVNKVACAGFEEVSLFYKKKEAMIAEKFNSDEIEMRILNGDGAAWIKHGMD